MDVEIQEIDNLLSDIIEILEVKPIVKNTECILAKSSPKPVVKFSSIKAIKEARTIIKREAVLLERAALIREDALKLLRVNKISEGKTKLNKAKEILVNVVLSREAFLINIIFQSSVESFFYLKIREFKKAHELMINSLKTHKVLYENYGHAIEARRIHLAMNVAKISSLSDDTISAFKLYTRLVKYIVNNSNTFPLKCCLLENPDAIEPKMRSFIFNQLINEMIKILSQNKSFEIMVLFDELIEDLKQNPFSEASIIFCWHNAYKAILNGDKTGYLKNSKTFLKKYKGLLS